jgi:hypothetical protein
LMSNSEPWDVIRYLTGLPPAVMTNKVFATVVPGRYRSHLQSEDTRVSVLISDLFRKQRR